MRCCGRRRLRGNFRRGSGTEPRGTLLRLGLPIGAAEPFRSGEIPSARIGGIADGFKVASEFKGNHRVACFGEKIGELTPGVFAGTRPADARGNLLPVCHK
jgi:hypothetical protein